MLSPLFRWALLILALSVSVLAQSRSGGGRPSGGSLGPTTAPQPGQGTITPPSSSSAIFITGKVVLDDGSELTEPAVIQTICRGRRHSETYSDGRGNFSFRFGDPTPSTAAAISDASSSNVVDRSGMQSTTNMQDCQLQAQLAGFSSQPIELSSHVGLTNNLDVGHLTLRRLEHVDGTSVSVTSYLAPPAAKKAYQKGLEQQKKGKWDEAQKSFEKAVQIYPRYATAWYQLGGLQLRNLPPTEQDLQAAKHSFEQSVAADPKYVNPYDGLAQIAMMKHDWPAVVDATGKLVALNPVNFPDAYYDSAVANYYLKNFDQAEKSALQGVRVDEAHQIPKMQYLLAMILLQKQNYQAASEHMQQFLGLAKQPEDVELARKGLAEIEKVSASAKQPPIVDLDK
jgi:tetratricopeptide (TPR) repeat protein